MKLFGSGRSTPGGEISTRRSSRFQTSALRVVLAVIVAYVVAVFGWVPASQAAGSWQPPQTDVAAASVQLVVSAYDSSGRELPYVYKKSVRTQVTNGVTQGQVTLFVGILTPESSAAPAIQPLNSSGWCTDDGSLSVESCTTLYFNSMACAGVTCATITSTTTRYYNWDPSSAVLSSASWTEGVYGPCYANCGTGFYSGSHPFGSHSVTSGTAYSYAGWWNGPYTKIWSASSLFRGGTNTLHWYYRGNAQTLTTYPRIPDLA